MKLRNTVACLLAIGINLGVSKNCTDTTYLRLKQIAVENLNRDRIYAYLKLDSLCALEKSNKDTATAVKPINIATVEAKPAAPAANSDQGKHTVLYNPKDSLLPGQDMKRKRTREYPGDYPNKTKKNGGVLFWVGAGAGALIFLVSAVRYNTISDECNPLFTIDLFKSEEECKSEADQARSSAGTGMVVGGLLGLAGLVGGVAVNSDAAKTNTMDMSGEKTDPVEKKCEDIEEYFNRNKCIEEQRPTESED
jgi:hypothetical protein